VSTTLLLRRATISRFSGSWSDDDFEVFDGERMVGRIFRQVGGKAWFWGMSLQLTQARESYGTAENLDDAKAAFKTKYEKWKARPPRQNR
jgi:hypothetical protein